MSFGKTLHDWRIKEEVTMQDLSSKTGIDQSLISKYEATKRIPSDKHLLAFASVMNTSLHTLRKEALTDKIVGMIEYEYDPMEILLAAESRVAYLSSTKVLQLQSVNEEVKKRLLEIDKLQEKWNKQKPLKSLQLEKLVEYFDVNYTYDSNRIEGNTLTLQETHLVINEGITVGGKSMREHLEAINHYEAISFIRDLADGKAEISKRNLLDLHRLVLKSIDNENAGVYRKVGVRISGSKHIPPDASKVQELMDDFYKFFHENNRKMHPVILAAEMHERLVSIHPFIDGNGRTARLLMNFILLKNGYTMAILKGDLESRLAYYAALEKVQVDNDTTPFYFLIADKVESSLKEHLELV